MEVLKYSPIKPRIMKEYENDGSPATSEQVRNKLLDQVKEAEFGSVTFQAASDYFALNYQRKLRGIELDNVASAGTNQSKRLYWESETRIREMQIALLEREIENNRSRVPGYSKAYFDITIGFDDLSTAARIEAEQKFPSDEKKQNTHVKEVFDGAYNQINDLVYAREAET